VRTTRGATSRWTARRLALAALATLAGCGARSALEAPSFDAGTPDVSPIPDCGIECTIGHACCLGGCDGPAVPTLNDCCPCQPGEVSTFVCGTPQCGG
jgi:hypothetical protein